MADDFDVAETAYGVAETAGTLIAEAAEVAGPTGAAVAGAAAAGVAIGMGIEYATDGAISDGISDGLMGLVGEEESYKAVQAFDDGNYVEGVGHMLSGAGDTIVEAASDAYDYAADTASDAYDAASEWVSDVFE